MDDTKFTGTPSEVKEQLTNSIPKQFEQAFAKVVTAGTRIMFSDESHDLMIEELQKDGDFAENIGNAMAGLMLLMFQKSNGTMPQEIILPAGTYLLAIGADFIEKVTGEEVTPDVMSQATQVMFDTLIAQTGTDPQQLHGAMESGLANYQGGA